MTVSTTYAGAASSGLQTSHSVDAASYTAPHAPDKPSQSSTSTASVHGLEHRRTFDNLRTRDHVSRPTDDNCDRRRPEEEPSRLSHKSTALIGKSITPFLRQHIPGVYAPLGKAGSTATMSKDKDPNSKFCYRHNPTSKCRRAADAHKMEKIQCELDKLPPDDQQAITHVWSLFSAAPAKHRELMLQGIITQCCFPQLSTVSREVQDQLKIDFLSALPNEICYQILCCLDTVSLCKAAQVSHRWHSLADDDLVWHRMCEQHIDRKCAKCGWGLPLLERHRLKQPANGSPAPPVQAPLSPPDSQRTTVKRNASVDAESSTSKRKCISRVSGEIITHGTRAQLEAERLHHPWKSVYRTRFMVGFNWRRGRCSIDVFKGHTNGVTCLQLDDGMLASGSYDGTVRLWDLETRREMLTLTGHTSGIRALQFDKKILVSASLDNTIKIWKRQTGELLSTLQGHNSGVFSVHFAGDYLASGSMDHAVKIFNFKTRETFCLRGHTDFVNQVFCDVKSMTVLSASDDLTVKLWDLRTKKCIMTYEGHVGQVQQVLPMPEDFEPELGIPKDGEDTASVASGRSAQDKLDRAHDRALYGPGFEDTDRPLPPTYFITGALDGTLRLFHGPTKKCLKTFFGHVEGIWGLAGNTLRLATGSNDATVKVWDARTGKCELTFAGHTGPVMCVGMSDSKLASGGDDGTIRVYNFDGMGMEEAETPC